VSGATKQLYAKNAYLNQQDTKRGVKVNMQMKKFT